VPVQRTSQGFKDISLSFQRHPITNDILPLKNEDAIKRSVQNLVRINIGEVFFNDLIGTKITGALFELANDDFIDPIKMEIETVITNYEPRVLLEQVSVTSLPDSNVLDIFIQYEINGLAVPSQNLSFILEPTRL
tara:strand:+ start:45 stop:449 length:405 start_codon:yes stop_codon:yes gene_type:complete